MEETSTSAAVDSSMQKALEHLKSVLVEGETIKAWATQPRICALTHRRNLVATTSNRLIFLQRRLLGGFGMLDFQWQDIQDAVLDVGIFGAHLKFKVGNNSDMQTQRSYSRILLYKNFNKEEAKAIYRIAQAREQEWREKRRIREMDEMRARTGIGVMNSPMAQSTEDMATRLQKAKEMLDNKLISDSEFESIKAKIISGL